MIIIKKILEITETETTETFQLICHEKDEGWELTREEMEKLRIMTERSLEDFYGRRERETVPAELYDDLYKKYTLACYQLEDKYRPEEVDQAEECPDFIEPPESTETPKNVQKEVQNEPKQAEKVQKEGKKTQKRVARDYTPYIKMDMDGVPSKEIMQKMQEDLNITAATADVYFYTRIKAKAPGKKEKFKDQELLEDIQSLPDYGSYTDFKDACANTDIGRGKYPVNQLRELYLQTHPNIKW